MSHFAVGVIVPKTLTIDLEEQINRLMDRYDENKSVAQYERECWCVGREAEHAGEMHANEVVGTWDAMRGKFHDEPKYLVLAGKPSEQRDEEGISAYWKEYTKEFDTEHDRVAKEFAEQHPFFGKPDPDCEECHGSGIELSEYNPLSKWDWHVIGGRWDGDMTGIETPSTDNGFNFGDEHHVPEKNLLPVSVLNKRAQAGGVYMFYAIVTPDGEWHARGEMGWFGTSYNETDKDAWKDETAAIYAKYAERFNIVQLDCHI